MLISLLMWSVGAAWLQLMLLCMLARQLLDVLYDRARVWTTS